MKQSKPCGLCLRPFKPYDDDEDNYSCETCDAPLCEWCVHSVMKHNADADLACAEHNVVHFCDFKVTWPMAPNNQRYKTLKDAQRRHPDGWCVCKTYCGGGV
jgi:hypothetical protein